MKNMLWGLGAAALVISAVAAQNPPAAEQDKAAVRQAAYDYGEGFYEGSAERMERAVHPAIIKRGVVSRPGIGSILTPMNAETLVELARQGTEKNRPADQRNISFALLDLRDNVASAKIFTVGFNDYLHLVKQDGRWRLVHVLWQPPVPTGAANAEADKTAVAQVLRDYFDGVAAGDAARVERLIHPEVALRSFGPNPQTGKFFLREGNRETMVAQVRLKAVQPPQNPAVTVLDVYDSIASVLVTTATGTSYWHLAKQNDQWRIVNRLNR